MHEALKPWQPSAADPWDIDAASHLWRRAGFGPTPAGLRATLRGTPGEAVGLLVRGPAEDPATRDLETIYESVLGSADPDKARAWLVARMARAGHQLREKMALFWHGHFATSLRKVRKLDWMMRQYRLFLDAGLGRFHVLLSGITRDPAMIRWLDNETNAKGRPNENYARELFELFTLGDGNYTEKDIKEAARAFTGWHILRGRFHFSKTLYDDGEKTVLGRTGRWGGDDVCRIALEQPACGCFLARKLLRFLVCPEPDEAVVTALGGELQARGYDVADTLQLLLGSRYFFDRAHRLALVRSPLEFVVGAARALDVPLDANAAVPVLRRLGQDLLAPPNVKGWPGHRAWINTATWLVRVNAARALANRYDGPADVLGRTGRILLGRPVPEAEKDKLLASGAGKRDLVHALLSLPEAHLA